MNLIALLSDYGLTDHYVGVVKAVIKGISPDAEFIDITHDVSPYDIREGAFILLQASRHLPRGCTVLAIVDPEVNTDRLSIAVKTKERVYVGPDNGLLYPAASVEGILSIYDVGSGPQVLSQRGTFAGRDIYAPTAAWVSEGRPLGQLGRRVKRMKVLELPGAAFTDASVSGVIMHVDRFGNAVTSIKGDGFDAWRRGRSTFLLRIRDKSVSVSLVSSYQEIEKVGIIVGSGGALEVSGKEGRPNVQLKAGDQVIIESVQRG